MIHIRVEILKRATGAQITGTSCSLNAMAVHPDMAMSQEGRILLNIFTTQKAPRN